MNIIDKKEAREEIVVKKSRFIASIYYIGSEDEAKERLSKVKKEFYEAKHHCFAYIVGDKKKQSDDGEPQGTGGKPILSLIEGKNLNNIIIIVSRIFGGVLLGTGGLTHAYQDAAKTALDACILRELIVGKELDIRIAYDLLTKVKKAIESHDKAKIVDIAYGDIINIKLNIDIDSFDTLKSKLNDVTSAKVEYIGEKDISYSI